MNGETDNDCNQNQDADADGNFFPSFHVHVTYLEFSDTVHRRWLSRTMTAQFSLQPETGNNRASSPQE